MAIGIAASGYESQANGIWAPDVLTGKILQGYHESALISQIARSNFLNESELFCGGQAIYSVAGELDIFGQDTDNNESPELVDGPNLKQDSMKVCQSKKLEVKISERDKQLMCTNFEKWEAEIKRQIEVGIRRYIDAYSIPKVIASAAPYNVGTRAGKQTHQYNLGDQGANALSITNAEEFENVIFDMIEVAKETGMIANPGEEIVSGEVATPIILIPSSLTRYAIALLKGLDICCSKENVLRTGVIGDLYGFRILATNQFKPLNFGSAGRINNIVLIDPERVLHAFKFITNKWYEGKFEDFLVMEFIFETKVIDPDAVVVANYKVSR